MKTISFVNMKGGVGKTTLALNVADCLARTHNKKVVVLDVDPQFNMTQCLFSAEDYVNHLKADKDTIINIFDTSQRPMASVVNGQSSHKPKELADIALEKRKNIWVLPGNIDLYRLEMRSGEGREFAILRFIEQNLSKQNFDYLIIDTPPTPSIWMTSALISTDYYVIPVKPDPLSVIGIDLLKNIIDARRQSYNLKLKCAGVVFTMVERPDSVIFSNSMRNLKNDTYWKDYVLDQYLPKRSFLARNQLQDPYVLDSQDFELRAKLTAITKALMDTFEDG